METRRPSSQHMPKRVAVQAWHPDWREQLRRGCLERVKEGRSQILWKLRRAQGTPPGNHLQKQEALKSTLRRIVSDELRGHNTCQSSKIPSLAPPPDLPSVRPSNDADMLWEYEPGEAATAGRAGWVGGPPWEDLREGEYEELLREMEQELHEDLEAEMRRGEAAMLQAEADREYEAAMGAALEVHHRELEEQQGVLCPICKVQPVHQNQSVLFCGCGQFRLDMRSEQVGVGYLKDRLAEVSQEHVDAGCRGAPHFGVEMQFGVPVLCMRCSICQTFQLVL